MDRSTVEPCGGRAIASRFCLVLMVSIGAAGTLAWALASHLGSGIHAEPQSSAVSGARFAADFDSFTREAAVLNSFAQHGVNCSQFGEQLARTSAALDLLNHSAPPSFTLKQLKFSAAVKSWALANRLWRRQISGNHNLGEGGNPTDHDRALARLNDDVHEWTGTSEFIGDVGYDGGRASNRYLQILFAMGARDFQEGLDTK